MVRQTPPTGKSSSSRTAATSVMATTGRAALAPPRQRQLHARSGDLAVPQPSRCDADVLRRSRAGYERRRHLRLAANSAAAQHDRSRARDALARSRSQARDAFCAAAEQCVQPLRLEPHHRDAVHFHHRWQPPAARLERARRFPHHLRRASPRRPHRARQGTP